MLAERAIDATLAPRDEQRERDPERDADPVRELRAAYGHAELGVHTEVLQGGRIAVGDAITVLP